MRYAKNSMLSSRGSNGIPERIPIDLPGGVPAYLPISLQLHTISCNIQKMTSWNDPNAFMTLSPLCPIPDTRCLIPDGIRTIFCLFPLFLPPIGMA